MTETVGIKLPAKVAGAIVTIASAIPMLAALLTATDPSTLGIDDDVMQIVTNWLVFAGGLINIAVVIFRLNLIPHVTSGVGLE